MAFTYEQAYTLLKNARNNGRQPHALLFTGSPDAGTHRLALTLAAELIYTRALPGFFSLLGMGITLIGLGTSELSFKKRG